MKFNLQDRLISFAVSIQEAADLLPETRGGSYMSAQLVRSGTAPSLMYGEATAAESRKDFIHKMKMALKELRESMVSLKIIRYRGYYPDAGILDQLIIENNELISIFVKSIQTAKENLSKGK